MHLFRNKYRIPSTRLQNWDYGWNAAYFVTICTHNRKHYFGEIIKSANNQNDKKMNLSDIGILAKHFWTEIPDHFPFVILDEFVIMPDHMHGIIIIDKKKDRDLLQTGQCPVSTDPISGQCPVSTDPKPEQRDSSINITPGQKRFRNQGKGTLSSIIGSYKSVVTKNSRKIDPNFTWQTRFHEHIIREPAEHMRIRQYIINNPGNWKKN